MLMLSIISIYLLLGFNLISLRLVFIIEVRYHEMIFDYLKDIIWQYWLDLDRFYNIYTSWKE